METILPQQLGPAPLLAKERNDVAPGSRVSAESAERKGRDHIFSAAQKIATGSGLTITQFDRVRHPQFVVLLLSKIAVSWSIMNLAANDIDVFTPLLHSTKKCFRVPDPHNLMVPDPIKLRDCET